MEDTRPYTRDCVPFAAFVAFYNQRYAAQMTLKDMSRKLWPYGILDGIHPTPEALAHHLAFVKEDGSVLWNAPLLCRYLKQRHGKKKWAWMTHAERNSYLARSTYRERNAVLRAMGYPTYDAYLRSALWHDIRERHLARHPSCFRCGKPATQVHHAVYTKKVLTLGGAHLYSVCSACHVAAEFSQAEGKMAPKYATQRLFT